MVPAGGMTCLGQNAFSPDDTRVVHEDYYQVTVGADARNDKTLSACCEGAPACFDDTG
jgi:hypothetical protein